MMGSVGGRAAGARGPLAARIACFAITLVLSTFGRGAIAPDSSMVAALGSASPEVIVVQITLNKERKGEFFVTVINGAFFARTKDLNAIGLVGVKGRTWTSGGEEYLGVNSIAGIDAKFDEARLSLDLAADPNLLPVTTVDMWAGRGEKVVYPDNASAFFNYDIGYAGGSSGFAAGVLAATQIGVRSGEFLFISDSTCNGALSRSRTSRAKQLSMLDASGAAVRTT